MKKKLVLLITTVLLLILVVPVLTGCGSQVVAQQPVQISQQAQGIWVNGIGEVTVTPDIAMLSLGIVSQELSVSLAQSKASEGMAKVMKALTDNGIASKDIQTGSFRIDQRTRWDDVNQTEKVTGYQVTNMVTIKIRDTGKAGTLIDSVVQAGGDLARINGINFSVEDPTGFYEQAREKAMADARKKAEQLAKLAGLTLGKATYIAEGAQSLNGSESYRTLGAVPAPVMSSASPISSGEIKITLNVQVAYSVSQ